MLIIRTRQIKIWLIQGTVTTCKKIPLYAASIEFGMSLKRGATRYEQKIELLFCYQTTNLLKI